MSFLVQWFYLLALAVWVGGIVFYSFFTTPAVFAHLPRETAGELLAALFPRYYLLGYVCGGILLFTTLLEAILVRHLPWIRLLLVLIMLGSSAYAGAVVRPEVHALKVQMKTVEEGTELGKSLQGRFDRLHRLAVILNLVVLGGGLFLLGIAAFRLRL
jgi:uncharacterized membrane protein